MTRKSRPTDTQRLDWIVNGGKVWKSRNRGYFSRRKGGNPCGGTCYGVDGRGAIDAAMRSEKR